jgi:hypothetical protein
MILELIAQAAPASPDPMISATAVTGIIGAITTLVVGIIAKLKVDAVKNESREVTLKKPVPTVRTQEEPEFVTMGVFNGHLQRIENSFDEIKEALEGERGTARIAQGNIHKRIDALSEKLTEKLSRLEGTSGAVKETVDRLLTMALEATKPTNNKTRQ